jgi:hypothetical protein
MRAVKAMVRDWSFWLYLGFLLLMLTGVGLQSSQHRDLMEVHRHCLRTLEAASSRNAIADQEHRLMKREIQALERRDETPRTKGESR